MKILLLNDNPVVRKLVALSAQKTKDDLSVIWSVEEAERNAYDLLIVDDAHYSDEVMSALGEKIQYKTSLLMATRGNATPAGFDKVINKPFLPTDLVDLFSQIAKDLTPLATEAIVVDETLEDKGFDITNLDDDLNLEDFDIKDEADSSEVKTKVLDHEEVQELQGLLDDTDNFDIEDELMEEESAVEDEDLLGSLDDDVLEVLEDKNPEVSSSNELDSVMDEFEFDFDDELLDLDAELEKPIEESLPEEVMDDALSDDEFGELEQQIQEAVEELGIEDLEQGLNDVDMGDYEDLVDLNSLSERDIKLAVGEEVEDEPEIHIGRGSHSSLDAEALSEAMGESLVVEADDELEDINMDVSTALKPVEQHHATAAEGIDALQALLKALSNAEVAKTLKGLSINININFGNEK